MPYEEIIEKLKALSPEIEEEMKKFIPQNHLENFYGAMWYHLGTGGKRIRPGLAILTGEALGVEKNKVMPFAVACELLHNWLLIHDDIEDGDKYRRGKPAVWVKYGLANGINVGDGMAHYALKAILETKKRGVEEKIVFELLDRFLDTAIKTAEGQAMEFNLREKNEVSEDEYMQMVKGKTAYYLTIPMVGAAIIARAGKEIIEKITQYGENIGPAFQIRDDIIDITEGKGREDIGNDIKEGKRSILVVYALEKCNEEERKTLLEILNKPREETSKEDVRKVIEIFEKTEAVERAQKKAEELYEKAIEVIADLPEELRNILTAMGEYMIKRKN